MAFDVVWVVFSIVVRFVTRWDVCIFMESVYNGIMMVDKFIYPFSEYLLGFDFLVWNIIVILSYV